MRSRYTAFVLQLEDYLINTWHSKTRPAALNLAEDPSIKWLGLQIKHAENTTETTATVEFIARYKVAGKATRLHEKSLFERVDGRWYYLSGEFNNWTYKTSNGLWDSNSVEPLISKGIAKPKGNRGHSNVYDFNTLPAEK